MRKILILTAVVMMFAGCATIMPVAKINWDKINSADLDNLKAGKIAFAPAVVFGAVTEVLKDEGWVIEQAAGDTLSASTVRKHGVTFYGSCDYAMSCKVTQEEKLSKLNWSTISYVSEFITNVDPVTPEPAARWDIAVYNKLVEKKLIVREIKPDAIAAPAEAQTVNPSATAVPVVKDSDLPPPPTEE